MGLRIVRYRWNDANLTVPTEPFPFRIASLLPDDDLSALGRWLADPGVARGLNLSPRRYDGAELRRYVAGFDGRSAVLFGVSALPSDLPVAIATFDINRRHRTGSWTIAIGERRFRGEAGLMAIGVLLFDWAFGAGGLEKVSSRVAASKLVLVHLLESVGVRREGFLRGEILAADGSRRLDEVVHGLLKPEWPGVRAAMLERLVRAQARAGM